MLMVFVVLLVMGIMFFLSMLQCEDFVVEIFNIIIVVVYLGVNLEDMESQVVDVIEEVVNELDDIQEICIMINDGVVVVVVELIFGLDIDDRYDEVVR